MYSYEESLIESWEAVYKQGQLTLWIFLALYESPKTTAQIKQYLIDKSLATINADDKSLYRSLRRYYDTNMVDHKPRPSKNGGPPMKQYFLTPIGRAVLYEFVNRNISILVNNPQVKEILR